MHDDEMRDMLIEYMGRGFLDNIIALFKQDIGLCRFIPDMLASESMQVRIGATALVEELASGYREGLRAAVPGLIALLRHANPTIRGDAASVLGTIKDQSASEALKAGLQDVHPGVRDAIREAMQEIEGA